MNEVHIDIGGGERADFFVHKARMNPGGMYVVIDPAIFHCPYPEIYKNLHLVNWAASKNGDWELPFADQSIDEANMNFIHDVLDGFLDGKDYVSIIKSLRRTIKPNGIVNVREPNGYIEFLAQEFNKYGFLTTNPASIDNDDTTETSLYLSGLSRNTDSIYSPMVFQARLT